MRLIIYIFLIGILNLFFSCAPRNCCNCKKKHKSSYYNKRNGFDKLVTRNNPGTVAISPNPNLNSNNATSNSGNDYVYKPGKKQNRNSAINNVFRLKTNPNKWSNYQYYDNIYLGGTTVKLAEGTLNSTLYNELQCFADALHHDKNINAEINVVIVDTANTLGNEALAQEIGKRIITFLENQQVELCRISLRASVISPSEVRKRYLIPDNIYDEVMKNMLLVYAVILPNG